MIALAVSLVLIGASYTYTGSRMFSPGKLNAKASANSSGGVQSHADLEDDCAACHPAFWSPSRMTHLCLDCHQSVIEELSDTSSLHGAVMAGFDKINCRDCHTEHNGPQASLTVFLSQEFPHELVGFALTGHQQINWDRQMVCADCHQEGFSNFEPVICLTCHEQVDAAYMSGHRDLFGIACLDCHDGVDSLGKDFNHNDAPFQLIGGHQAVACGECHPDARSLADLQMTPTACEACHNTDSPHEGSMGNQCGVCHNPTAWDDATFDHSTTGFLLIGGHDNLACEDCHADSTYQGLEPSCISCHDEDDPHQRQFGNSCSNCHVVTSWQEVSFDHSGDYARNCISCHTADKPANHFDAQCSACHATNAWLPADFDHKAAGANDCLNCHSGDKPRNHFTSQCSACHNAKAWLPASFNHSAAGAIDCASCHSSDRPQNHFAGQCSQCHSTNAWKPASFKHSFPLNHEGANRRCQLCHTNNNYNAYTCYNCHEHSPSKMQDKHKEVNNFSDNCIRCHEDGREADD